jgi:HEAT repeat protein/thiol-disulfide isomerase/thioredoxin
MRCCNRRIIAVLLARWFLAVVVAGNLLLPKQAAAAGFAEHPSLKAASDAAVVDQSLVLLIFGAEWCGPCKLLKKEMQSDLFQQGVGALQVVHIDIDADEKSARSFAVNALPDLVLLTADGKIVARQAGFQEATGLLAWIDQGRARAKAGKWEGIAPGAELDEIAAKAAGSGLKTNDIQQLIVMLGRSDPAERAGAARILLGERDAVVGPLIDALGDPYLGIRIGASELLQRLVPDRKLADPWQSPADLTNTIAGWRQWWVETGKLPTPAARAVGNLDPNVLSSVQGAITALMSSDPVSRTEAMASLVAHGSAALPSIRDGIRKAENAGDHRSIAFLEDVRWAILISDGVERRTEGARRILARGKGPERQAITARLARAGRDSLPALTELVNDNDSLVVEAAVRGLSGIGGKDAIPAMAGLLKASDSNLRMTAAQALGTSRNIDAVKPLLEVLDDPDEIVVCTALSAVEQIRSSKRNASPAETQELSDGLNPTLVDPRWRVRAAAVEVVGKLGVRELTDSIRKLLEDPDGFVVRNTLIALDTLNAAPDVKELVEVSTRLPALRFEVVKALLQQQSDEGTKVVTEIFRDANPDQQIAILNLLAQHQTGESESGEAGWKPLLNQAATSNDSRLRQAAARVLSKQPPAVAAEMITPLLADSDRQTRIVAAQTMLILMQTNRQTDRLLFSGGSGKSAKTNKTVITAERLAAWNAALAGNSADESDIILAIADLVTSQEKIELHSIQAAVEKVNSPTLDALGDSGALGLLLARLPWPEGQAVLEKFAGNPRLFALAASHSSTAPEAIRQFLLDPVRFHATVDRASGEELLATLQTVSGRNDGVDATWSLLSQHPSAQAIARELLSSTNAAWRAASIYTLGLSKAEQHWPVFQQALADSNVWVRVAAVQALVPQPYDRQVLEQRLAPALADSDIRVAQFAASALLEPEVREGAAISDGLEIFRFESVYGGRSKSYSRSDDRPLNVMESKPGYLQQARRWMSMTNATEAAVFALLLAQHGESDGVKWLVENSGKGNENGGREETMLMAVALSRDTQYLPVVRRAMDSRTDEYQLRELLKVMKGMTGAEARQLRLEINKRIRQNAGSTGAAFD